MPSQKRERTKSLSVIVDLVREQAEEVYGVVALVPSKSLIDNIDTILKKENNSDGVAVRITREGYEITIHCILAFGSNVVEVINELQQHVVYALKNKLNISVKQFNVFVKNIK